MNRFTQVIGKYAKSWPKIVVFEGTIAYLCIPLQTLPYLAIYLGYNALLKLQNRLLRSNEKIFSYKFQYEQVHAGQW